MGGGVNLLAMGASWGDVGFHMLRTLYFLGVAAFITDPVIMGVDLRFMVNTIAV